MYEFSDAARRESTLPFLLPKDDGVSSISRQSWGVDELNHALERRLFQEPHVPFVENLLMGELETQREAKRKNTPYDHFTHRDRERVTDLLTAPFAEILGVPFPNGKQYHGKLGRRLLQARTVFDTLLEHQPFDPATGEVNSFDLVTTLGLLYHFVLKRLENCQINGNTHVDEPTLHETAIVQAHESYHRVMQPTSRFPQYDIRSSVVIQEGGARHFQVLVNEQLAAATGDERYRYARRELVLTDIAPLYFELCRRFGRVPILSRETFMREAEQFVRPEEREHLLRERLLNRHGFPQSSNPYAKGYALCKLAERTHAPAEIHRAFLRNDPHPLLE